MNDNTTPMSFSNGLSDEQDEAIDDMIIEISNLQSRVANMGRHRSYALAVTKLDEARHWLRDRKFRAPGE